MRTPSLLAALAVTATLAGCATYNVHTDADRTLMAQVQCHTVAWAGGFRNDSALRAGIANPINESRLRDAIGAHLQNVGLTLVGDPAQAECLVGYGIGERTIVDETYPGWAPGGFYGWGGWGRRGWGGWGGGFAAGPGFYGPDVYQQGFIAVNLYDNRSHKPMWHATAEQNLHGAEGDEAARRIQGAVDAIFQKYPRPVTAP